MQVTCSCGKLLNVPDTLAGRNVRCPGCKKVFKAEGAAAPATPAKITFSCPCGRKLTAPLIAAGKRVSCPACNKDLMVPEAAPAAPKPPAAAPAVAAAAAAAGKDKDEGSGLYTLAKPKCPNCKAELDVNAQFCVQCGTNLSTGSKVQKVETQKQDAATVAISPKVKLIFIGVGAVVVIGAALGIWLALSKGSKAKQAQPRTSTTDASKDEKKELGIADYVPFVVRQPKAVKVQMDKLAARQSVEAFRAQSGRLPKSREELEQAGYALPKLPDGQDYDYNPNTGEFEAYQLPPEENKP